MNKSSTNVKKWRNLVKQRMVECMGGKCQICGYNKSNRALAFHHIDPTQKDFSFGSIMSKPKKWDSLIVELKKCILLCHNCHCEVHDGTSFIPKNYQQFDETLLTNKTTSNSKTKTITKNFIKPKNNCSVCGNEKSIKIKFCSIICARKSKQKINWQEYDLKILYENFSILEISKQLGVSDVAVHKQLKKLNIK